MNYRQQQSANTAKFIQLSAEEQKAAKAEGYRNVGKVGVAKSAEILARYQPVYSGYTEELIDGDTLVTVRDSGETVYQLSSKLVELEDVVDTTPEEIEEREEAKKEFVESCFFADVPCLEILESEERAALADEAEIMEYRIVNLYSRKKPLYVQQLIDLTGGDRIYAALLVKAMLFRCRIQLSGDMIFDNLA